MSTRSKIKCSITAIIILLIVATTSDAASMISLHARMEEVWKRATAMMTSALAQTSQPTAATPTATPSPRRTLARVIDALSGDTVSVGIGGKTYVVHYAGIDAPDPRTIIGSMATQTNRRFVKARTVYLEKDVSETDQDGYLSRHVFLEDGTFIGAKLVYFGYATVRADYPNTRYRDALLKMQQEAKEAEFGLWNPGPVYGSLPAPTQPPQSAPVAQPTQKGCCKICTTGKACGDSCISRDEECHQPTGCACDG